MLLACVLGVASAASFSASAPPQILIVQRRPVGAPEDATDFKIGMILADELGRNGQTIPVVWSELDPLFRSYLDERLVVGERVEPKQEDVMRTARNVRAQYVLSVEAVIIDAKLLPRVQLYQVGRGSPIWRYGFDDKNTQSFLVMIGDAPDWDATARSLAKTMITGLFDGPLKEIGGPVAPPRLDPATGGGGGSNIGAGGIASIVEPPPPVVDAAASKAVMDEAQKHIEAGRTDLAILLLKDAIDLDPFEPERRILLIELLSQQGMNEQAADEGRRAARLSVDNSDLWLAAARCWMLAGKPEEAKQDIQEALARGADGFLAQRILGDINLFEGKLSQAIAAYEKALGFEDRFAARMGLALAYGLNGDLDASEAQLAAAKIPAGGATPEQYYFSIQLIDLAASDLAKRMSSLLPSIRVRGGEMAPAAEEVERQATALARILSKMPPPEAHQKSHGERTLAHKLLSQSALEMMAFAKQGDKEAGDESVLSLAEATRIMGNARELFGAERTYRPMPVPPNGG